jgi:sugar lactone lactonase YvrE
LALERCFALLDQDGGAVDVGAELWSDTTVRMNDGDCDPEGRFYCGSMAYDATNGRGALYRLDPDGTTTVVLSGVTISNGLAWAPSGDMVYYVDSLTERIDAFDYDPATGAFSNRHPLVEIPRERGLPDGLTVDAAGGIWAALYGGSAVHRYVPEGTLDMVVELPVRNVTSCAFGGPGLEDLYITTSRHGLADGEEREAGSLYCVTPGMNGQPTRLFGG